MPKTESNAIALGTPAPDFLLRDAEGRLHGLSHYAEKPALLVAFISNRCPFVLGIRSEFAAFARRNAARGLQVIAINSNDAHAHPEETLARLGGEAATQGYDFPYLKDHYQTVARAYDAVCTPDLYLFDEDRRLTYHGQFDGFRPGNGVAATGADLQAAVDALFDGAPPIAPQIPSIGCNIKWRDGAEARQTVAAE